MNAKLNPKTNKAAVVIQYKISPHLDRSKTSLVSAARLSHNRADLAQQLALANESKDWQRVTDLQTTADGVLIPVKAMPGSRSNAVRGTQDGVLKIAVTQVAEKGKANNAIRDVLAKTLGVRKSHVEIVGGLTSTRKTFLIRAISADAVQQAIADLKLRTGPSN